MSGSIESVYLPGWEYNRLLQPDPFESRISALPAASLWQGAHQFWMFRTVFCTLESLENEIAAADALGWATGSIIRQLIADGVIEGVHWATQLPPPARERLRATHQLLRADHPEHVVRDLIAARDVAQLELIKSHPLSPILEAPPCRRLRDSKQLEHRSTSATGNAAGLGQHLIDTLLAKFAAPLLPGLVACRPPGADLPP